MDNSLSSLFQGCVVANLLIDAKFVFWITDLYVVSAVELQHIVALVLKMLGFILNIRVLDQISGFVKMAGMTAGSAWQFGLSF